MDRDDDAPLCTWPDADVRAWGPPRLPFPVSAPYRPRPDLARLGATVHGRVERAVLDADDDAPGALREKFAHVRTAPGRCVALDAGLAADPAAVAARVRAALAAVLAAGGGSSPAAANPGHANPGEANPGEANPGEASLAEAAPPGLRAAPTAPLEQVDGEFRAGLAGWAVDASPDAPFMPRALRPDARPVLDWIASRPPAERPLHVLALALQEDVAWIETGADGVARARMLHVCFPSGWDPARKIGSDFATIHAPVADADLLRSSAPALARALTTQGPFVRFVWTLSPDGTRSRHPADAPPWPPSPDPWFRCERQVSLPIAADPSGRPAAALFLIRLHRAPLAQAAHSAERLATLRAALDSMSPATLAYKGLAARLDALRAWIDLRRGATGG